MTPTLASLFPNASASTVAANPHLVAAPNGGSGKQNESGAILKPRRGKMNKTEEAFALMLEGDKRAGAILRYEFEGITLRWADMRYTPDFVVFIDASVTTGPNIWERHKRTEIKLIEVKGPYVHYEQQAVARFKGCRAYWPEFAFEMWQKTKEGWKRKF